VRLLLTRLSLSRRRQPPRTLSAAVAAAPAPFVCLSPPAQPDAHVTAAEPGWTFVGQLPSLKASGAPAQDGALFSAL